MCFEVLGTVSDENDGKTHVLPTTNSSYVSKFIYLIVEENNLLKIIAKPFLLYPD